MAKNTKAARGKRRSAAQLRTEILKIPLSQEELAEVEEMATQYRQTKAAWVRQVLREAFEKVHGKPPTKS